MDRTYIFKAGRKRLCVLGALFLSVSLFSACGQNTGVKETEAEITAAPASAAAAAAVTEAVPVTMEDRTEAETETETDAGSGIIEKKFEYEIIKTGEYEPDVDRAIYTHEEISGMLAHTDFGAIRNAEGFQPGPYLNPGEKSNVRYSLRETDYVTESGEKGYEYEAGEFECFSYPEIGIRAICLPVTLHADREPLTYNNQATSVFSFDRQEFEETFGYRAPRYPVSVYGADGAKGESLYGESWRDRLYVGEDAASGEYVLSRKAGVFSLENSSYLLEVSSRKTDLLPGADTAFAMKPQEILGKLCALGTDALWPEDTKNVRIFMKDGYRYVYLYTSKSGDVRTVTDGWLCRVKDGISQCVHMRTDFDDGTDGYRLIDYVLNYSLEFYDMDSVRYDEGNMEDYRRQLEAYQKGEGPDPGTGGYWLCEDFLY